MGMSRANPFIACAAAAFVSATVAACGGGGSGSGGGALAPLPHAPNGTHQTSASPSPASCPVATKWHAKVGVECPGSALQGLRFYPPMLTVNVGDTITWQFNSHEPHTVSFLAPSQTPPPPNSLTAQLPAGGTTEDGSTFTSSGFMFAGQTYSLKFTKAGTFAMFCLIHQPEMQGSIVVQPAGSAYPKTQGQYDAQAGVLMTTDINAAQSSVGSFPFTPGGTQLVAGIAPGLAVGPPSNATVLRFLAGATLSASSVSVPVGTTLTWTNESNNEPHTVTFPIAGQTPPPTLSPFAPPSGPSSYDGTTLVNSGVLLPGGSFSLKLTKAGTYTYYCLFHDDEGMLATVTVH